jgi:hypothetical protein
MQSNTRQMCYLLCINYPYLSWNICSCYIISKNYIKKE